MKVIGAIDSNMYGVTSGKEYEVRSEYDSVYELQIDNGNIACRPKGFYTVVEE